VRHVLLSVNKNLDHERWQVASSALGVYLQECMSVETACFLCSGCTSSFQVGLCLYSAQVGFIQIPNQRTLGRRMSPVPASLQGFSVLTAQLYPVGASEKHGYRNISAKVPGQCITNPLESRHQGKVSCQQPQIVLIAPTCHDSRPLVPLPAELLVWFL